jgi:hypothetical protein
MIVTPAHLIKKYFPKPIETTKELYIRLELDEAGYTYLNWLQDLETHCLTKYVDAADYKHLPDKEKNYWISQKAFGTIIQSSPSKISDEIRACIMDISKKVAKDPEFAKQLQDQFDHETGVELETPKVSRTLKSKYNKTGQDAFEFMVKDNNRLYMDIISGYNFQPGQKIKNVAIRFDLVAENGVPNHTIYITITLTNDQTLSYQTNWKCAEEKPRYAAILVSKIISINLFEDNKKLVDSYDYILDRSEFEALEQDLVKIIQEVNLNNIIA